MALSNNDIKQEKDYLDFTIKEISKKIESIGDSL